MNGKPRLSIIIPAYNSTSDLENLLRSIRAYPIPDMEIWVMDDGSSPPLEKTAKTCGTYYHYQENSGPSIARNRGAELAQSDFLLFLDSDTEVLPDTLPKILDIINKKDFHVATFMYHPVSLNKGFAPEFKGFFDAFVWIFRKEGPTTEINGQCCLFRKETFLKLGGWNSSFNGPDVEHEEFSRRILKQKKYTIMFYPGIFVKHRFPTLKKLLTSLFRRSLFWARLRIKGQVHYNDLRNTPMYALVTLMPLLSLFSLFCGIFYRPFLSVTTIPLFIYFIGNIPLFRYLLRGGGIGKGFIYIVHHFLISLSVGLGGLIGYLTFWQSKV